MKFIISMQDILKNIIKVVTVEGYDSNYYLKEIDDTNGIQRGIRESMAFALQLKVLGKDFDKENKLGLDQILVLKNVVGYFKVKISEKYADKMKALINLCDKFCEELNVRAVQEVSTGQEDDRSVHGIHTQKVLKERKSDDGLRKR